MAASAVRRDQGRSFQVQTHRFLLRQAESKRHLEAELGTRSWEEREEEEEDLNLGYALRKATLRGDLYAYAH
jgi:hypothetical protein